MMYEVKLHETDNSYKVLYINGEFALNVHYTYLPKLEKLKTVSNPMFCLQCFNISETDYKAPFFKERKNYNLYYCGCRGWD